MGEDQGTGTEGGRGRGQQTPGEGAKASLVARGRAGAKMYQLGPVLVEGERARGVECRV